MEVTPPGPDADFGMSRGFLHDLATIFYQDRMKAALKAVREQAALRLAALWPLLARSAHSLWALQRAELDAAGVDLRPNANGPPGRHARFIIICCPRTGPPAGRAAVGIALLDRTGGAVIVP
jgi:hypothetical protein